MPIRIAINGYGRIGRNVLRALYESHQQDSINIVAINEVASPDAIAHLTQYDSTHGRFPFSVELVNDKLIIDGDSINLINRNNLEDLPWSEFGIDIVIDCTGIYGSKEDAQAHIDAGAKKVIFSHPASTDVDATIIYGINHEQLTGDETYQGGYQLQGEYLAHLVY